MHGVIVILCSQGHQTGCMMHPIKFVICDQPPLGGDLTESMSSLVRIPEGSSRLPAHRGEDLLGGHR